MSESEIPVIQVNSTPSPTAPVVATSNLAGASSLDAKNSDAKNSDAPNQPSEAAPVADAKEDSKEDPKFASKFSLLAKREKEVFRKEQAIKERLEKAEAYQKAAELAKSNPAAYIESAGLTMEDLVKYYLSPEAAEPSPQEKTLKRVDEMAQKLADFEKKEQEKLQAQIQQNQSNQLNQIKSAISDFVEQDSTNYELIKAYSREEDVFQVMWRSYDESSGKIQLTIQQATDLVEAQLLDEATKEAERLQKLTKLRSKFGESKQPAAQQRLSTEQPQARIQYEASGNKLKTLTNSVSTISPAPSRYLDRDESIREAAKKIVWK